jgi:hypothetical protein
MTVDPRLLAQMKALRDRAQQIRRMAAVLSLRNDRDRLEAQAAELEREADRLEAASPDR